jgi:hypothetical protein
MTGQAVAIGLSASLVLCLTGGTAAAQDVARADVAIHVDKVPAEDTAAAVADPNWTAPRTSWGDPSFQGTWSSDDMISIPRERPEKFGSREQVTAEEFTERAKADAAFRNRVLNQESYYSRSWGVRSFGYTSQIIDPPDGRMPAKTADAVPRSTRGSYSGGPYDDFDDFNLYDRCITRGLSSLVPSPARYGNGIYIAQSPDAFTITYEMVHETRVVKLDGKPHAGDNVRQYLGNSRGHWEGDTLVVETVNLTDKTNIGDVQNSTQMKLTERFRRVDPEMIEYIGTVEDPAAFTAPFTYRLMLTKHPGYRVYEYSCHEGNTVVSGGLSGERAFERRVAEAVAKGEPVPVHERLDDLGPLPEDGTALFNINEGK